MREVSGRLLLPWEAVGLAYGENKPRQEFFQEKEKKEVQRLRLWQMQGYLGLENQGDIPGQVIWIEIPYFQEVEDHFAWWMWSVLYQLSLRAERGPCLPYLRCLSQWWQNKKMPQFGQFSAIQKIPELTLNATPGNRGLPCKDIVDGGKSVL